MSRGRTHGHGVSDSVGVVVVVDRQPELGATFLGLLLPLLERALAGVSLFATILWIEAGLSSDGISSSNFL